MGQIQILVTAFVLLAASGLGHSQEDKTISPQAKAYLQEFFDIVKRNSLRKAKVDWETLRRQTFEKAAGAQEPIDTYEAIRFALRGLGDHHSFLQLSKELSEKENARRKVKPDGPVKSNAKLASPFAERRQPEGLLHKKKGKCLVPRLVVPFKPFAEMPVMNAYAEVLYRFIIQADAKKPCGWIIDLRGNGGGAVFPMMAGVGVLLKEGDASYAIDADGGRTAFFYRNGESGVREPSGKEIILTKLEGRPYRIKRNLPIAILIDRGTASSGETMAVAFRGRPKTRFFGEHTAGASTSTQGFKLSDGANVVLATAVDVDRNGKVYPSGIEPDETAPLGDRALSADEDPVIQAALGWLGRQKRRPAPSNNQ